MAAKPKSFSAQCDSWISKSQKRVDALCQRSVQFVIDKATISDAGVIRRRKEGQANPPVVRGVIPVNTGALRRSLVSSLAGGLTLYGADNYRAVIGVMKGGDIATFTWGGGDVNYALHVHYGTGKMDGRFWVEDAIVDWKAIVASQAEWVRRNVD